MLVLVRRFAFRHPFLISLRSHLFDCSLFCYLANVFMRATKAGRQEPVKGFLYAERGLFSERDGIGCRAVFLLVVSVLGSLRRRRTRDVLPSYEAAL